MKYVDVVYRMVNVESPPSRGRGLKFLFFAGILGLTRVAPLAGAWIEINKNIFIPKD